MVIKLNLTLDEAISEMESIVEELGPDNRYPEEEVGSTVYFLDDGAPSCGVGYLLDWHSIDLEMLVDQPENGGLSPWAVNTRVFGALGVETPDSSVTQFLERFQFHQDTGSNYGCSLDEAKAAVGR